MKVNTWHNLFTSLAMLLPNIVCTGSFESTHFLQDISPSACSTSAHLSALKSTSPPLCSSFLWPITFFEMHHYQHHSGHWGWVTSGLTTLIQSDALCQKNPPAQISWAVIAHEWHTNKDTVLISHQSTSRFRRVNSSGHQNYLGFNLASFSSNKMECLALKTPKVVR